MDATDFIHKPIYLPYTKLTLPYATCGELCKVTNLKNRQKWRILKKAKAVTLPKLSDLCPKPPFLPPLGDEDEDMKHLRTRSNAQAPKANYFKKRRMNQDR